ncbi:MAG: CHAT domain-containing protein [Ardenticatenaceae bacterium]|nr:CHAT domain-containing protein [Anaerolineales bacterium]MCB9005875.1 CHAT domain-containing protein [Ardenticatenaceae bacterium]
MLINSYREIVIKVTVENVSSLPHQYRLQIWYPPAGVGQSRVQKFDFGHVQHFLDNVNHRQVDQTDLIAFGRILAEWLFTKQERRRFEQARRVLSDYDGLRLRLALPPILVQIPWEYLYLPRGRGEDDATGFLALDPRISIVRHLSADDYQPTKDTVLHSRRMLFVQANPTDQANLNSKDEFAAVSNALKETNIEITQLQDGTVPNLNTSLTTGSEPLDIFHFSGHGAFKLTGPARSFESYQGQGQIVLENEANQSHPLGADELAVMLRGQGVQLAVLNACQTGSSDELNLWSGVVTALMRVDIPAAVAMQFRVGDRSAITFSRTFYEAVATGLPLEQAVSMARIALFTNGDSDFWRDWGAPVLYQQSGNSFVLPIIRDAVERQKLEDQLRAKMEKRLEALHPVAKWNNVYRLLSAILFIVSAGFVLEITQRFLAGSPDPLGITYLLGQAVVTLYGAKEALSKLGGDSLETIFDISRLSVTFRPLIRLIIAVVVLAVTLLSFSIFLPDLSRCYNNWGLFAQFGGIKDLDGDGVSDLGCRIFPWGKQLVQISAERRFERAIYLNPNNAVAHYNLAQYYETSFNYEAAQEHYQTSVKLGLSQAINASARLYLLEGEAEKALVLLNSLDNPNETVNPRIQCTQLRNYGWAYFLQGQYSSADSVLRQAQNIGNSGAGDPNEECPIFVLLTTYCLRAQALDEIDMDKPDTEMLIEEYRYCRDASEQLNTTIEYQSWFWQAQKRIEELRHSGGQ